MIRHYTEGWADGFHYKITYREIRNEPESAGAPAADVLAPNDVVLIEW